MKHVYKFYKEKYEHPLEYQLFSDILEEFNMRLVKKIYEGCYISLPYSLGDIYIIKYKARIRFNEDMTPVTKGKYGLIDYKATNELWKEHPELKNKERVLYDNFHSDNFKFKIKWRKNYTNRFHKLYNFKACRNFSRGINTYVRTHPNQEYYDK